MLQKVLTTGFTYVLYSTEVNSWFMSAGIYELAVYLEEYHWDTYGV